MFYAFLHSSVHSKHKDCPPVVCEAEDHTSLLGHRQQAVNIHSQQTEMPDGKKN